jgi:AP2-associated kinase
MAQMKCRIVLIMTASMLREQPQSRPTIYQVLREACLMQGIEVPIKDVCFSSPMFYPLSSDKPQIYAGRTQSETRRNQQLPSLPDQTIASPPAVGAVFSPPAQPKQYIPEVVPMRRGRPTASNVPATTKPSQSPLKGTSSDPFAALDAKSPSPVTTDDISSRFPSLDQFHLLHDQGSKFDFDSTSPPPAAQPKPISQRVTEKLADDAFALPQANTAGTSIMRPSSSVSRAQKIISSNPEFQSVTAASAPARQSSPERPKMVSQGTMTAPDSTPIERTTSNQLPGAPSQSNYKAPPIHRFPPSDHHRSSSVPRNQAATLSPLMTTAEIPLRPSNITRTTSYQPRPVTHMRQASSSRPSLEGGRPSLDEPSPRNSTSSSRPRPASIYLESDLDYLRERELSGKQQKLIPSPAEIAVTSPNSEDEPIQSNVEFLRAMEDQDSSGKHRRSSSTASKQIKRSSMPSMSLSGTKTLLAGKFGDAFKRFENNTSSNNASPSNVAQDRPKRASVAMNEMARRDILTPIAGSEATDGRSDDGMFEEGELSAAQRRDLERARLEEEENRVAAAAAEYRRRMNQEGGIKAGGMTKAASIQNKVRSLLDENSRPETVRTAEGYGRFTDAHATPQARDDTASANPYPKPHVARKPTLPSSTRPDLTYPKSRGAASSPVPPASGSNMPRPTSRPSAPPKPMHLNSLPTGSREAAPYGSSPPKARQEFRRDMTPAEKEDYIAEFSKRFPSLSGIEMVDADLSSYPQDIKGGKEV